MVHELKQRVAPQPPRRRESKSSRFTRLAERRVSQTLHGLWLIGNLANRNNYDYTRDQAEQVIAALDAGMRQLRGRFTEEAPARAKAFRFKK